MDDSRRSWRDLSICVDVSHDVVPPLLLLDLCNAKILVGNSQVLPHLAQGFVGDTLNAELLLRLGQEQPQLAPCRVAAALREELRHLCRAITPCQRCLVQVEDCGAGLLLHGGYAALDVEGVCGVGHGWCGVLSTRLNSLPVWSR